MKQTLLSLLMMLQPLMAQAEVVKIGDIYYNLITESKQAEVVSGSNKYTGNIVIPSSVVYNDVTYSVTYIGSYVFYGCIDLTSITIPNSVTSIGEWAFFACSGLSSVIIPNSVTDIGKSAFRGCFNLTSVTIPNSVTSIGGSAFYNCSGLTSVTIPNSVSFIGESAFYGCTSLTAVFITDLEPWCKIEFADYYSRPLSCYAHHLYLNGKEIKELVIPNSVTYISSYTFYNCYDLTSVTIPNSVTTIGDNAFQGCSGLTSVTIGSGVNHIGWHAFAYCPELTDVYCYAENMPSIKRDAFDYSNIEHVTLHVPASAHNDYINTEPWSNFKSIVKIDMPEHTLIYILDGIEYKSFQVEEESIIVPEAAPIKEGYTFSGWSEIPTKMPAEDVTVTGSFTINKYKLIYKLDGAEYKSCDLEYGAIITLEPAPTKDGYTFSGWSEIPETMPANDVTVTGSFTKIIQEQCAMPTIALRGGKLIFECETPDVEFNYNITANGSKSGTGNYLSMTPSYTVRVYASKEGMEDSETAAQVIYYKNGDANLDGVISVTDIGVIVDMILGKTPANSRKQQEEEPQ